MEEQNLNKARESIWRHIETGAPKQVIMDIIDVYAGMVAIREVNSTLHRLAVETHARKERPEDESGTGS